MKKLVFAAALLLSMNNSFAQNIDQLINAKEVERIEKILSADDMQGRKAFTPGIDKAATFIAGEFKKSGLKLFPGLTDYRQPFSMTKAKFVSASGTLNGNPVRSENIIAITTDADIDINERSGYTTVSIDTGKELIKSALELIAKKEKTIVFVNTVYAKDFNRLKRLKRETFDKNPPVLFVLSNEQPSVYSFLIKHEITSSTAANVVGILPGKSKKDEYVIFSGHYDHLGIGKANAAGDSVYNGANDDAAGTTAVIMLANYFAKLNNNERTLIFVAFTAEEIGGFGSQYFSKQLDADKTVAMFNIEMIGTESSWGKNSAYITGYDKSDFGKLLQQNLSGSAFRFEPDPYPKQQLFYRSDNATLAALGVPAHTISTSQMDSDKTYHTLDDELETLDINNMAEIIKAIAISSKGIVSGQQTPSRVEKMR